MSLDLIYAIKEYYIDGTEDSVNVVRDIFLYLKELSGGKDKELEKRIDDWLDENHICKDCGCKMTFYEWEEPHVELEPYIEYEKMSCYLCPECGRE